MSHRILKKDEILSINHIPIINFTPSYFDHTLLLLDADDSPIHPSDRTLFKQFGGGSGSCFNDSSRVEDICDVAPPSCILGEGEVSFHHDLFCLDVMILLPRV
jgi:hypothetical protein